MEEVVIVAPYSTPDRITEFTYSYDEVRKDGGKGDLYLDFIDQTVLPMMESNLRITLKGKLGILGSSLGGLISCYAGWTRFDKYTRIGCMSSSFWWNKMDFINKIMVTNPIPPVSSRPLIYMDSGTDGGE